MLILLTNSVHKTSVLIQTKNKKPDGKLVMTEYMYKKARNKLCGSLYCNCGVSVGGKYKIHRFYEDQGILYYAKEITNNRK